MSLLARRIGVAPSTSFIHPADLDADASSDLSVQHAPVPLANMYGSQESVAAGLGPRNGYQPVGGDESDGGGLTSSVSVSSECSAAGHATYGSWTGYCFTVNYILGVGVLGMPYAFYRGGWALSSLCLALVSVMATFTALWLIDVSLRAQLVRRHDQSLMHDGTASLPMLVSERGGSGAVVVGGEINSPLTTGGASHTRYEMNELVQIFLGVKARRFYELLVIFYLVGALWSYASVFSSSLASHIPLPGINHGNSCDIYKDHSSSCSDLYLTYMGMFAIVAVPLTCLDLTEMKLMQIALAIFRFVSLGTMMATSLAAMYSYRNPDPDAQSSETKPYISEGMHAFNFSELGLVFPIAIYSQIFHHSVPGLLHPLKRKAAAPRVFSGVLATTCALYAGLGITVAFYYGKSIPQTATLAWADYSGGHDRPGESKPGWVHFISYLVVLFPPIDIISAFPLNAITLGNNMLCAFVRDPVKQALRRYRLPFRLLAAAPPIAGAMLVKDLSTILKYTGCVGVLIAFVYPCLLQWASRRKCEQLGLVVVSSDAEARASPAEAAQSLAAPTLNGKLINSRISTWIVLAFAMVGLVAVIVLSILGLSN